jgi:hypothetical protein
MENLPAYICSHIFAQLESSNIQNVSLTSWRFNQIIGQYPQVMNKLKLVSNERRKT